MSEAVEDTAGATPESAEGVKSATGMRGDELVGGERHMVSKLGPRKASEAAEAAEAAETAEAGWLELFRRVCKPVTPVTPLTVRVRNDNGKGRCGSKRR